MINESSLVIDIGLEVIEEFKRDVLENGTEEEKKELKKILKEFKKDIKGV